MRGSTALGLALAALAAAACFLGPPPLPYDAEALRLQCGIGPGVELDETQAICLARLAGLGADESCVLGIERRVGPGDRPVWRVADPCTRVALEVTVRGGEVLAVQVDEAREAVER